MDGWKSSSSQERPVDFNVAEEEKFTDRDFLFPKLMNQFQI